MKTHFGVNLLALILATSGAWGDEPEAALRSTRVLLTATPTLGGRIVAAGGLEDARSLASARGDAELVDPFFDDGRGRVLTPKPLSGRILAGRAGHAAVALSGGRVLLVGGDVAGTVELFDPEVGPSGEFRAICSLPGGPRMALTATLLASGEVLVTGGMTPARRSSAAAAVVDVDARVAHEVAPLSVPRASHTATLLDDGRVLVAGGVGCRTTELFDPVARTFSSGPELRHVRDDHRATRLRDGTVLITGGQNEGGVSTRTAERFRPDPEVFVAVPNMEFARADHAQVMLEDGRVLVLGGEEDDGEGRDIVLDSVEVFEPGMTRFVTLAPLETARDDHAAVPLRDGRVAVIGGQTTGDRALRAIEYYRPRRP